MKSSRRLALGLILGTSACILACGVAFWLQQRSVQQNYPTFVPWKYTDPITQEDVQYLCSVLSLSDRDERCDNSRSVYAPDFDQEVTDLADSGRLIAFDDWEAIFGRFQTYCTPNKSTDYQCEYDFHRDGVFMIFVFFDPSGQMKSWRFSLFGD
ncbi:MAG: hypothetical protein ACE5GO_04805 [Anaerolineales bacterium]